MVGSTGFIQLRRGIDEHVREGRISFFEGALYVFILLNTNPSTGVCHGSAGLFATIYSISSRTCRDALEKLEDKGYLKRFPVRGKHGSYPILINKFLCSHGAMKGMYVNCLKTTSYTNIFYEIRDDSVDESGDEDVNDGVNESAGSKILDTRDKRQDKEQELSLLSPEAPNQQRIRPEEFANTWNRLRGNLPKVEKFTESRRKKILVRINQGITLERFGDAVVCCRDKPFLSGDNDRGWTANFDWLIDNDKNIEKAIVNPYGSNRSTGGIANGKSNDPRVVAQSARDVIGRARANREANAGLVYIPQPSANGGPSGRLHGDTIDGINSSADQGPHSKVIEGM